MPAVLIRTEEELEAGASQPRAWIASIGAPAAGMSR